VARGLRGRGGSLELLQRPELLDAFGVAHGAVGAGQQLDPAAHDGRVDRRRE
jgi:hypothetical protein